MTISIPGELQNAEFKFALLKRGEKIPIEQNWQGTNNYFFFERELQQHISSGGNYGVLGGFGRLVIIDADVPAVADAIKAALPPTFTVETGSGGFHFYYFCPELKKPIRLYQGVENVGDVQSQGKMAVGPNCIHPNGNSYKVVNAEAIATVAEEDIRFAVREFLPQKQQREKELTPITAPMFLKIKDTIDVSGFTLRGEELQGPHPLHGSKNGTNFCVNETKNIWHCFRCGTGGGIWEWIAVKEGLIPCHLVQKGSITLLMPKLKKIMQEKYNVQFEDTDKDAIDELVEKTLNTFNIISMMDSDEMFIYDSLKKCYQPYGEKIIKAFLLNNFNERIGRTAYNEIIHSIQGKTYIARTQLNPLGLFPCQNGILDLKTMNLLPHSPIYYTTYIAPIQFGEGYYPNKFLEFLAQVALPEDIAEIQKMFGYCLIPTQNHQKAFLFVGSGSNGKSVLLNVLTEVLGKQNVSTLSLHEIEKEKFALPVMYGKMANICADLSSLSIASLSKFKQITGGDNLYLERKFREGMADSIGAKLIFSANEVPYSKEGFEPAVLRRWCIFEFKNKFEGAKKDTHLLEKLTTEEEKAGILNWAIEGLKKLNEEGFSNDEKTQKLLMDYGDPLIGFSQNFLFERDNIVPKEDVYAWFCEFLSEKYDMKKERLTLVQFNRRIRGFLPAGVQEFETKNRNGNNVKAWKHLAVKGKLTNLQNDVLILR